jgi:glycosyltransferase involved in cell wall biosynthesis
METVDALNPLRVLHAIETGGPGGAETVLLGLVSGLDPLRVKSTVILPDKRWLYDQLREREVPCILEEPGSRTPIAQIARLAREFDLIHSHLPDENFYAAIASKLAGVPAITTYHGMIHTGFKPRIKLTAVKYLSASVVAVSDHLVAQLRQQGFDPARLHRIYNGLDTTRYRQSRVGALRHELGLPITVRLVGTVANFRVTKGYPYLAEAAQRVCSQFPDVHFVAVGEKDAEIFPALDRQLNDLKIADRFHVLGFRPDVPAMLSEFDVFVLASSSEGFSISTIEAMAAKLPIVVTRCGGPQEIITQDVTGLMVPIADPAALGESIAALLSDPARSGAMAVRAQADAQARFSINSMIGQYQRLYMKVVAGV